MTKYYLKNKNEVFLEDDNIVLKAVYEGDSWTSNIVFNIYKDLTRPYKEKLIKLLEQVDLSLFRGHSCFDRPSGAIVDDAETLKNFEYTLDHKSDNTAMKFIILVLLTNVRFFNPYIIDQYLLHERIEDYEQPIRRVLDPFNKFSINDVACTDAKEFVNVNQISSLFANLDSSKTFHDSPKNSFLKEKSAQHETIKSAKHLKKLQDYMYFYNNHNQDNYDWSFQNRADSLRIALKGYENVSVAELTAFLSLTDFDNELYECLDQSSRDVLYIDELPKLRDFVDKYNIDHTCFEEEKFLELFEKSFQVLKVYDKNASSYNNPYKSVFGDYHFYAFLFMLMRGNEEKFSQFCEFIVNESKYDKDLAAFYVSDNLQDIIEWSKPESSISSIPFSLLANLI